MQHPVALFNNILNLHICRHKICISDITVQSKWVLHEIVRKIISEPGAAPGHKQPPKALHYSIRPADTYCVRAGIYTDT